eukprot:4064770-Ditylum_brightwellii.AAC.1
MIVLAIVLMMLTLVMMVITIVMVVMKVLTSTLHISHKQLIVICQREANNKHVVCNKDDDVDDDVGDCNDDFIDDDVDTVEVVDGTDNHLTHLSQAADCCLIE